MIQHSVKWKDLKHENVYLEMNFYDSNAHVAIMFFFKNLNVFCVRANEHESKSTLFRKESYSRTIFWLDFFNDTKIEKHSIMKSF